MICYKTLLNAIIENNNSLNDREDFLDTDNNKMQDAGNADAAKFNADEQEKFANERESNEAENIDAGTATPTGETGPPLTTQGDIEEIEENMGGTTNLSLDQLKKEHDPEGMEGE
ncbi:hypothetical protein ACFQ3S_16595 [Mucilaginibacter terrae]|uniref:hypothetical protein n=1 Tax=Mucilaginibacter terrae TaxID=1955052 RepID=UPI003637A8D7